MKKLFKNSNPFVLLLIPVVFALIMGIIYQVGQKQELLKEASVQTEQATSLFIKGINVFKTVCSIAKENVW